MLVAPSSSESVASVAQAAEFDLHAASAQCFGALAGGVDGYRVAGQALYRAAGLADEVGVAIVSVGALRRGQLETPDVVAIVRAMQETRLGHVHQVAVQGGPIETRVDEIIGDFAVSQRSPVSFEHRQDGDAWRGCAQPAFSE